MLRWQGPKLGPGDIYEVEESGRVAFADPRTVLAGRKQAAFVSGLRDGTYYYRVRVKPAAGDAGPWSAPYVLRVRHHSLALGLALLAIGAVVFVLTVAFVAARGFRSRDEVES